MSGDSAGGAERADRGGAELERAEAAAPARAAQGFYRGGASAARRIRGRRLVVLPHERAARGILHARDAALQSRGLRVDKIKKLRPERRDLFYYKAYCRERQGDKASAVKYYEEHLKSEPEDVKAMVRLGWLYLDRKDYNAALKWFREAARQEKKDPPRGSKLRKRAKARRKSWPAAKRCCA